MFSDAQGDAGFTASYNNHMGNPVAINSSGVIGRLGADAVLVPAVFVAVTEQL